MSVGNFTAGGGVGLQWPSDVEQGGRVPPCAVVAVCEHASVLANAQSNRERQGAWTSHVWPGTGRCSLTRGDVKCSVGYRCAFIFPSTACINVRLITHVSDYLILRKSSVRMLRSAVCCQMSIVTPSL